MNGETIILILIGVLGIALGCFVGYYIAKKTKLLDSFSESSKKMNKVLNDPDELKKKIEESIKKVNPNGEGEVEIWDNDTKVSLNVVEKDGKRVLEVDRLKSKETPKISTGTPSEKAPIVDPVKPENTKPKNQNPNKAQQAN